MCFAFNSRKGCSILTVATCPEETCSFYKSREELKDERQKANSRLASLNATKQKYIADKYFNGKMPWIEGGEAHVC